MRRPFDTNLLKIPEGHGDGTVRLTEHLVKIHAQARHGGLIDEICRNARKGRQSLIGAGQITCQEIAFRPVKFEFECKRVPARPAVFRQKRLAIGETP